MNNRDRAREVVEEWSAAVDAGEETDLEEFIERALDAAAAEEREHIRSLIKDLRAMTCDGGESEDERRFIGGTCDVIDAAIRHHAARNEVKP